MSPTHPFLYRELRLAKNPTMGIWAEEFEEIRSMFFEKPFNGNNKPNGYCDEPNDIYSKMDAFYFTTSWKKLRSFTVVANFIVTSPIIMEDIIPSTTFLANSNMKV
uniref:Uncharacterized protein n=1 Tax=Solanum lycopersicum TaxID=4081 RepID=A0A3Q7IWS0_SOLLC